jgi:hypothetical protein
MKQVLLFFTCFLLAGCIRDYSPEARHQQFLFLYGMRVGHDVRTEFKNIPTGKVLDNGLVEIMIKFSNQNCINFYQYDPKTFIIKNWHWEGSECFAAS